MRFHPSQRHAFSRRSHYRQRDEELNFSGQEVPDAEIFREHHRADGTPKRTFMSRAKAKAEVRRQMALGYPKASAYRCSVCGRWHVGHRRKRNQ